MEDKDKLFYFLIFIVVSLVIGTIYWITTSSYRCVSNPLVYGVSLYQSTSDFTCTCSPKDSTENMILVTKDNITYINNINFSIDTILK